MKVFGSISGRCYRQIIVYRLYVFIYNNPRLSVLKNLPLVIHLDLKLIKIAVVTFYSQEKNNAKSKKVR